MMAAGYMSESVITLLILLIWYWHQRAGRKGCLHFFHLVSVTDDERMRHIS